MSRTLLSGLLILLLTGCAVSPSPPATVVQESDSHAGLLQWLELQAEIAALSPGQSTAALTDIGPLATDNELFHYALLNHQTGTYGGWIRARDSFGELVRDATLSAEQRQLADLLRASSQQRINSYLALKNLRQDSAALEEELASVQGQKAELEQKIQALTELEAAISTRKEEAPDAGQITPR